MKRFVEVMVEVKDNDHCSKNCQYFSRDNEQQCWCNIVRVIIGLEKDEHQGILRSFYCKDNTRPYNPLR